MSTPAPDGRPVAGRYRLRTLIGQGGMGRVWAAHDEVLDRDVAVKEVLVPTAVPDAEREALLTRTLREGRAAARVRDPRVVAVYDVVEDDDRPWLVLQLLEPCSLADVLATEGPLQPVRAAAIGLQVLEGLAAVHAAGVLHRDVKPANVLFGPDGGAVLADFGVATLDEEEAATSSGLVLGSPAYLAPERARGEAPTPAADLWSLGATLFAAVEGHAPFHREGPLPTLGALLTEDVPPASAAGPLAPAIAALLTKDPGARPDADRARALLMAALTADPLPSAGRPAAVGTAAGTIDEPTAPMALPVVPETDGHEAWEVPAARVVRPRSAVPAAPAAPVVPAPRGRRRVLVALAAVALLAGPLTALAERPGASVPEAQSVGTSLFSTTPKRPTTTPVVTAPTTATARKSPATSSAKHIVAPAVRVASATLSRTASDSDTDSGSTPAHQTPRVPQAQSQPQSQPPGALGDQGGSNDKHKGGDNGGNGNAGNGGNGNGDNGNGNGGGDNGNGGGDNGNGNGRGNGGNGNGDNGNGNGGGRGNGDTGNDNDNDGNDGGGNGNSIIEG